MSENYGAFVHWDISNECFVAESSSLMICVGTGSTRGEALEALEIEVELWKKTASSLKPVEPEQPRRIIEHHSPTRNNPFSVKAENKNIQPEKPALLDRIKILLPDYQSPRLNILIDNEYPIIKVIGEVDMHSAPILRERGLVRTS